MSREESRRKGIKILKWNKYALLPLFCLAVFGVFLSGVNVVALFGSVLGGIVLALLMYKSWCSGGWWFGAIVGLWIGAAVGVPLVIFPSYQVTPVIQMLVSWLWVLVGVSGTLFAFRHRLLGSS